MHRSIRRGLAIGSLCGLLAGCAVAPPSAVEDACEIFTEKPEWYEASLRSEERWGLPIQIQLAIVRQESSFQHDARPSRARVLGMPMWWRSSSAYGYAQAKDSTWDWYRLKTGNGSADRDDYADAVDFIGWYSDVSQQRLGIAKWDTYRLYLAYHEGHGGFERKTYLHKRWLMDVARKVEGYAERYGQQLRACRQAPARRPSHWPFLVRALLPLSDSAQVSRAPMRPDSLALRGSAQIG
jgi:hypothetical protein